MKVEAERRYFVATTGVGPNGSGDLLIVPLARYHLDEVLPVVSALHDLGLSATVALPVPTAQRAARWRTTTRRLEELRLDAERRGIAPFDHQTEGALLDRHRGVLVFNDWGTTQEFVRAAARRGLRTLAKVEGVQDFDDVDVGRDRGAYRTVSHTLCQGRNDTEALRQHPTTVVGSCRLEAIRDRETVDPFDDLVVINLNFTYGVLTEHRRRWLGSAVRACRAAGRPFVVSRHMADRGLVRIPNLTREPVERLLERATVLISRFSTLCFEAMALGVEVVYHDPHREGVAAQLDPGSAFALTRSEHELRIALSSPPRPRAAVRTANHAYFTRQVSIDGNLPAAMRSALAIREQLEASR